MHITRPLLTILLLAGAPHAYAAESYDNCTGFIDALPATIDTQGTWCLRHNLSTAIASGDAITVDTNNVTIDCNGFKIGGLAAGDGSATTGIHANNRQNVTIRRCSLRGFRRGIQLSGAGHLVEGNRLDQSLFMAITVFGENNLVRRNLVYDTGGYVGSPHTFGIVVEGSAIENVVSGVFSAVANGNVYGIQANGDGAAVRGNRVRNLEPSGASNAFAIMPTAADIAVIDNVISSPATTNGQGIDAGLGQRTTCTGNTITGFASAITGCGTSTGNLTLP